LSKDASACDTTRELVDNKANPRLAPQPTEWLWIAAQAFGAAGDGERADALLRQAVSVMKVRSESIDDARVREAFLDLPFNRALHTRC
jgi:hypothetical protein